MTPLTADQIDRLIAARNAITNRTDDYPNLTAVDHIDAVLRDGVPQSWRDDVDRLLGRPLADYSRKSHAAIITARMADAALPAEQQQTWHAPNETQIAVDWLAENMIGAPAAAANQGVIDDLTEAQHDTAEDWRHCRIAE